ncbi:MAG TPA: ferritin-like domain-containing protein [Longimicrobiales bacterium]
MIPAGSPALAALHHARAAERSQALFYRALATMAEAIEDAELAERLNGLHADEQHHLSRLSARLLELGERLVDLGPPDLPEVGLEAWEKLAREREQVEIDRYDALLQQDMDGETREMIESFARAERHHAASLGGKWMDA